MTFMVTKEHAGLSAEIPQFKKLGIRSHELSGFHLQDVRVPAIAASTPTSARR